LTDDSANFTPTTISVALPQTPKTARKDENLNINGYRFYLKLIGKLRKSKIGNKKFYSFFTHCTSSQEVLVLL